MSGYTAKGSKNRKAKGKKKGGWTCGFDDTPVRGDGAGIGHRTAADRAFWKEIRASERESARRYKIIDKRLAAATKVYEKAADKIFQRSEARISKADAAWARATD